MKTRYFIFISYKGTAYHGWQIQPGAITVQKTLDDALSLILNEKIRTIGAGRTDTGVHAKLFCAHFDTISEDLNNKIISRVNKYLPKDISVNSLQKVSPEANARFSAISRTYKYFISKNKDPFSDWSSWMISYKLDTEIMNQACQILLKYSDFTSFSRLHSNTRTNVCKIYHASWSELENSLLFEIKADRFLRNMVRAIVGTMVDVGRRKLTLNEFEKIINAKDRCRAGKSAPAKGLFITEIEYPDNIFTNKKIYCK